MQCGSFKTLFPNLVLDFLQVTLFRNFAFVSLDCARLDLLFIVVCLLGSFCKRLRLHADKVIIFDVAFVVYSYIFNGLSKLAVELVEDLYVLLVYWV